MSELKSAREIALERTRNLRLSENEVEELKKTEVVNHAKILITRYLETDGRSEEWTREFGRMNESERNALIKEMRNLLLERIELAGDNEVIFASIMMLNGKIRAELIEGIKEVCAHYKTELDKASSSLEHTIRDNLKKSGISGSGIKINPEGSEGWRETAEQISHPYLAKLEQLKKSLSAI